VAVKARIFVIFQFNYLTN